MRAYAIDFSAAKVRAFTSTRAANDAATEADDVVPATVEGLSQTKATLAQIVALHNAYAAKPRKGFDNRAAGFEALLTVFGAIDAAPAPAAIDAAPAPAALVPVEAAPVAADEAPAAPGKRGRGHKYAGMHIYPTRASMAENPRREGSVGYDLMEICRARPGLTYEELLAADPRAGANHVKWDFEHGFIDVRSE